MATIVFDADGVLWDGIIVYRDEVTLRSSVREVLKELHKRNHTLICCSKNDRALLREYLTIHKIYKFFDQIEASLHTPKSELFSRFYHEDQPTVFVDDDPFQRAEVKNSYPAVECEFYPDVLDLLDHPFVARAESAEDKARADLIRSQRAREQAEHGYSNNFQEFLRKSDLVLTFHTPQTIVQRSSRVLDLLNRTNELKATRHRYTQLPEVENLVCASLTDTFGDYGLIAALVLRSQHDAIWIHDLAVSCRTMGRGVGTALVVRVCQFAHFPVYGVVEATEDNWRMQPLYEFLGFSRVGQDVVVGEELIGKATTWRWTPTESPEVYYPDWLTIKEERRWGEAERCQGLRCESPYLEAEDRSRG